MALNRRVSKSAHKNPPTANGSPGSKRVLNENTIDALALLGVSASLAQLLRYFALRPDARPYGRQLRRVLGSSGSSFESDMARLVALGALQRIEDGSLIRYAIAPRSRLWAAIRSLVGDDADPVVMVRAAMCDVAGIEAAFVFGSMAKHTGIREDSDIDVLVVEGPSIDRHALLRQLFEAGMLIGREVNAVRYTTQALADRLGDRHHPASRFVREALGGPKRWVAGTGSALLPLFAAAGLNVQDIEPAS